MPTNEETPKGVQGDEGEGEQTNLISRWGCGGLKLGKKEGIKRCAGNEPVQYTQRRREGARSLLNGGDIPKKVIVVKRKRGSTHSLKRVFYRKDPVGGSFIRN